jgi:hypothetical protein
MNIRSLHTRCGVILKMGVIVCGSSLHMAGLAASLRVNPDVDVTSIPANAAALVHRIDELAPAVVAFDLDELPGDLAISLLRDRPDLILVGVDPSSEGMLLLSGRREQPVSAAELLQVITEGSAGGSRSALRSADEPHHEVTDSEDDSD